MVSTSSALSTRLRWAGFVIILAVLFLTLGWRAALIVALALPLTVAFTLASDAEVVVSVYDLQGREVARLVDGRRETGPHDAVWHGRDASGRPSPRRSWSTARRTGGSGRSATCSRCTATSWPTCCAGPA